MIEFDIGKFYNNLKIFEFLYSLNFSLFHFEHLMYYYFITISRSFLMSYLSEMKLTITSRQFLSKRVSVVHMAAS